MDMFFIVRKEEELKRSCVEILQKALSYEKVRAVLKGSGKRKRLYDPVTTWAIWLGQTLSPDHSCRNALAGARSAGLLAKDASVHTGGYCQARDRLSENALHRLGRELGRDLMKAEGAEHRWHGRRVIIPDGSSVALPDTAANQSVYPQPNTQLTGCGFPVMYLATLISLSSGALLDFKTGTGNGNELSLWRRLRHFLQVGDVVLGDSKYAAYADVALFAERGIDTVARIGKRKTDFSKGKIIALDDHIVEWSRPKHLPGWLKGKSLPEKLPVRELCFRVEVPGFRPETVTLMTTLLDPEVYPKEEIAGLFFGRWQIELRLRDIKTSLGMDLLRTKTPDRVRKELWMYLSGYNLLRSLMWNATSKGEKAIARVSFQGCRQRFLAATARNCPARMFHYFYRQLLSDIAHDLNPFRPWRIEPRAIKRRKKQYDLLNKPREILRRKLIEKVA
jgi:hypothetical protein